MRRLCVLFWIVAVGFLVIGSQAEAQVGTATVGPPGSGWVLSQEELDNLPRSGDIWNLQFASALVRDRVNVGGSETGTQSSVSALGSSVQNNTFLLDGFNITDLTGAGRNPDYFNLTSVQKIRVLANGLGAEYGGHGGAVINIVTKSGGDQYVGTASVGGTWASEFDDAAFQHPGGGLYDGGNEFAVTYGGPLVRNRLSFFGSYDRTGINRDVSAAGVLTPGDFSANAYTGKLRLDPIPLHQLTVLFSGNALDREGEGASETRRPDTTWNQNGAFNILGATYNGTFKETVSLEAKFGLVWNRADALPRGGTRTPVVQGGVFDGSFFEFHSDRDSSELSADVNWRPSASPWSVDAGFGYRAFGDTSSTEIPGGTLTSLDQSSSFPLAVFPAVSSWKLGLGRTWAYGEAAYRFDRFTVRAGLRWDDFSGENKASTVGANPLRPETVRSASFDGSTPDLSWGGVAPSFRFAWDVANDGRTLIRGGVGLYFDQLVSDVVGHTNPIAFDPYRGAEGFLFTDTSGDRTWQPNEAKGPSAFFGGIPTTDPAFFTTDNQIAAGLEAPRTSEWTIGFERRPKDTFRWGLDYTHRSVDRVIDDSRLVDAAGGPRVSIPGDYVNGPILTGTNVSGDPFSIQTFTLNPQLAFTGGSRLSNGVREQGYDGLSLNFEKRMDCLMFDGHFTWESSAWSVPSAFFVDANNLRGAEDNDGEVVAPQSASAAKSEVFLNGSWSTNLTGMYRIARNSDYGVDLGFNIYARRGLPVFAYAAIDPGDGVDREVEVPDDARYDDLFVLDLRVAKSFSFARPGVGLTVGFDIFNVLQSDPMLQQQVDTRSGAYLVPRERLSPRALQLGVRFRF
jgi:hypothetical protein